MPVTLPKKLTLARFFALLVQVTIVEKSRCGGDAQAPVTGPVPVSVAVATSWTALPTPTLAAAGVTCTSDRVAEAPCTTQGCIPSVPVAADVLPPRVARKTAVPLPT